MLDDDGPAKTAMASFNCAASVLHSSAVLAASIGVALPSSVVTSRHPASTTSSANSALHDSSTLLIHRESGKHGVPSPLPPPPRKVTPYACTHMTAGAYGDVVAVVVALVVVVVVGVVVGVVTSQSTKPPATTASCMASSRAAASKHESRVPPCPCKLLEKRQANASASADASGPSNSRSAALSAPGVPEPWQLRALIMAVGMSYVAPHFNSSE